MKRILLIQGANMMHLGKREPEFYGTTTAKELDAMLMAHAGSKGYELEICYTNLGRADPDTGAARRQDGMALLQPAAARSADEPLQRGGG